MAKQGQADRFHQGTLTDGWRWFGAHPATRRGRPGWTFRVWAPHAEAVSVVGDFNGWDGYAHPMWKRDDETWVLFIPGLNGLFEVAPFTLREIGLVVLLAFLPTVVIQIYKVICDALRSRRQDA